MEPEDVEDTPSIIQKIIIYNKSAVPSQENNEEYAGTAQNNAAPARAIRKEKTLKPYNLQLVKSEPAELSDMMESENADAIEIKLEEPSDNDDDEEEEEESIENISREIAKLDQTPQSSEKPHQQRNERVKVYSNPRKTANNLQKPPTQQQKATILNFHTKTIQGNLLELNDMEVTNEEVVEQEEFNNLEYTVITANKRTPRRAKKFNESVSYAESSSDEDAPLKKKKLYTELTVASSYNNDASNIDEAGVNSDNLIEEEGMKSPEPKKTKSKNFRTYVRKNSRNSTSPLKTKKTNNKKRVSVDEAELEEEEEDENGEYDTDNCSRSEWVPEEYAEYKREYLIKSSGKNVKMHKCKHCALEFGSYYALRKHRALKHNDAGKETETLRKKKKEPTEESAGNSDEEESRSEWLPEDYAQYKIKHNIDKMKRGQWYKCKICCAVFHNYYKLNKHKVEHERKADPYDCNQCEAKLKDLESFTAHIRVHQGKIPYMCKKCDNGFQTKEELSDHEQVHIFEKSPPAPKRYRCDICGKEFRKLCDIERHTRVHTGEKPCECNICHKRFQQSHNLSKHLLTHLHVRPFQCDICNRKFGRIDVLNRHLLTHSMEKPFKCLMCSKGFIRQIQLNNHLIKSHPESVNTENDGASDDNDDGSDEELEEEEVAE